MSLTTNPDQQIPRVSVIVVNWNVAELCIEAVTSLYEKGGLAKEEIELFLIDNASSDDSLVVLREGLPDVNVIANSENVGFGRANSQVFDDCQGEYVFLLNPDTVMTEGALKKALEMMKGNPDWGVLGLRLLNADGSFQRAGGGAFPQIKALAWNYLWLNRMFPTSWSPPPLFLEGDPQGTMRIDWVSGAALLLRPEACRGVLFDHAYWMYGEDIDLCERVARNGMAVLYTSEASIIHLSGQSVRKQQNEDLLAAPIKGPRAFYQRQHGSSKLWLYDAILLVGYGLRYLIYTALSILKSTGDYESRALMSARHLRTTWNHFGK